MLPEHTSATPQNPPLSARLEADHSRWQQVTMELINYLIIPGIWVLLGLGAIRAWYFEKWRLACILVFLWLVICAAAAYAVLVGTTNRRARELQTSKMPMIPNLPECPYFGPGTDDEDDDDLKLPADWTGDPFDYLPEVYIPTDEDLQFAERYRQGDISGGYIRSQVACFCCPKPKEQHETRRENFATIQSLATEANLTLPKSLVELATRDEYVDRIRHNSVWFHPQPRLVDLPAASECKILELFYEGQGCGYWSLLLCPDGSAPMICGDDSIDIESNYPSGYRPDMASFTFHQCARNFDEWLTIYFLDCQRDDENYEEMLKKFPGM